MDSHFQSPWLRSTHHLVILRMSCQISGSQLPTSHIHARNTKYPPTHNWRSECNLRPLHDSYCKASCHYVNYSYSTNEWECSHWEILQRKRRGWRRADLNRGWWMTWLKAQRKSRAAQRSGIRWWLMSAAVISSLVKCDVRDRKYKRMQHHRHCGECM